MERSRLARYRTRRLIPWAAVAITFLVGAGAVVYGSVPHTFNSGDTLQAADLNSNFAALDQRITALESAKSSVKIVMDNVPGPLPASPGLTATFTSAGGAITVIASGSAFQQASEGVLSIFVELDGLSIIGTLKGYANEPNSHKSLSTRAFYVPSLAAGTHTIGFVADANTSTISNSADYYSATVIELGR